MSYLLTIFFFVLFLNILTPGINATGNQLLCFSINQSQTLPQTNIRGHIFWMPGA
jgi:hypothetical protein